MSITSLASPGRSPLRGLLGCSGVPTTVAKAAADPKCRAIPPSKCVPVNSTAPKTSTHQLDTSESGAYTLEERKEIPILKHRMGIDEKTIEDIVQRIVSVAEPDKIILSRSTCSSLPRNGSRKTRMSLVALPTRPTNMGR